MLTLVLLDDRFRFFLTNSLTCVLFFVVDGTLVQSDELEEAGDVAAHSGTEADDAGGTGSDDGDGSGNTNYSWQHVGPARETVLRLWTVSPVSHCPTTCAQNWAIGTSE